jgi:hypothetical protein
MAFGLIRVRELSVGEIGATDIHNGRKYEELGIEPPENINKELMHRSSSTYIRSDAPDYVRKDNLSDVIKHRMDEAGVKARKNSVVAIEFICSASKEFFDVYSSSGWFSNCEQWLEKKYGKGNIVAKYEHRDESTPHAHFIILPIVQKEVKWKNSKGEGKKIENRLCARDLTGDKDKLSKLQDDYHNFIKPYGQTYGVEFYRGSKANNELKEYTKRTDYKLGEFRNQLDRLDKQIQITTEKLNKGLISIQEAKTTTDNARNQISQIQGQKSSIQSELERLRDEAARKENMRQHRNEDGKWKERGGSGLDFHQLTPEIKKAEEAEKKRKFLESIPDIDTEKKPDKPKEYLPGF